MSTSAKQTLFYDELLQKVQNLLVCYAECLNIEINRIEVYKEHLDGANWHVVSYRSSSDDNDVSECRRAIAAEIRHLRTCYDVEVRATI